MNKLLLRLGRPVALCLSLMVTAQMTVTAMPLQQDQSQPATPAQPTQPATPSAQPAQQRTTSQPSKPGTTTTEPNEPEPALSSRTEDSSSAQDMERRDMQNPVGTAAAPVTRPSGIAGSRPAGAAIAPAKQRRVKAIFIRVGLIVAGAAAAGAVIGLSKGSPSHPQ